ncbi:MAG: DNA adenine methylase [Chloroflexi bacterium]|nr:DNA adenine methylase [Chloroflexota bacterium]
MSVPQPFPYQGSKRKIAQAIISLFPDQVDTLIEPFAGSGAVSIAAATHDKTRRFVLNDINAPLMALWKKILTDSESLAKQYESLWFAQQNQESDYYFYIRSEFNKTHQPHYLLYLMARCVKAAIRYNANGEFNQSPDHRRQGMHPATMRKNILLTAKLLGGKTMLLSLDYREALAQVQPLDIVYLDPPYQGVCQKQDPRYVQGLSFESFVETLHDLNSRSISYIVSYDGRTGHKTYGQTLPESLGLSYLEINAGRSSQATLLGRDSVTFESLYLSPALSVRIKHKSAAVQQLALWA